jgi:hypothetical protein
LDANLMLFEYDAFIFHQRADDTGPTLAMFLAPAGEILSGRMSIALALKTGSPHSGSRKRAGSTAFDVSSLTILRTRSRPQS